VLKQAIFKPIPEGGKVPLGYGLAWRDWTTFTGVCMPLPFSLVVRLAVWVFYHVVNPRWLEVRATDYAVISFQLAMYKFFFTQYKSGATFEQARRNWMNRVPRWLEE
jgi:hypothetical protein